ncbi:Glutathione gamma-glutamylcysteinyltransferase 1-like protein [Drosera capensis]
MASETAAGFLEMSSNLVTQTELTYCGLSSLTTILNALSIDPQRVWKGAWRWYDETMLITNEPLRKKINADGLTFEDLVDVVPKDKVYLQAVFASDSSLQEFREYLHKTC